MLERYERKTREIIDLFLDHKLSFGECIVRLDAALASLIPHLEGHQIPRVRAVMLANSEIVMTEVERRNSK